MADMEHIHRLQGQQLGLLTRSQALAAGMTPAAIVWKLRCGEWVTRRRGVYASASVQPTAAHTALAAILTVDGPASMPP